MPSLAVSSDEEKGKLVAREVVSILWGKLIKSLPSGREVVKPSSICKVVGSAEIESDDKVDSINLEVLFNSSLVCVG